MTRREVRAARRAPAKRMHEEVDFDIPRPLPVEPMTPEQEAQFAMEYQRDACAEHAGPLIPGNY